MKNLTTLSILFCFLFVISSQAQKIIDENIGFHHGGSSFFRFKRTIIETDKNIIIGKDNIIKSYDKTGELDESFGKMGVLEIDASARLEIRAIFIEDDNLLVIANERNHTLLKQFIYDIQGQELKSSHVTATPFRHEFYDVLLQRDGKVLLVGAFTDENLNHFYFAMRLTPQGMIDSTLQMQFPTKENRITDNHTLTTVIQRGDGKLLVAGSEHNEINLRLYNLDGTIDSSFGNNGKTLINASPGGYSGSAIQNLHLVNNKILVTGSVKGPSSGNGQYLFVSRFLANGQPDVTFADNGIAIHAKNESDIKNGQLQASVIQEDGKILLIGNRVRDQYANLRQGLLVRYNEDGSLDESFMSGGEFNLKILNNTDIIYVSPTENGYDLLFTGIEDEDIPDYPMEFSRLFLMNLVTEFSTANNELDNNTLSKFFPNPVLDNVSLKYRLANTEKIKVRLFDISGKFIINLLEEKQTAGSHIENFNLSHLPKGAYFLFFTTSNNKEIIKFVK